MEKQLVDDMGYPIFRRTCLKLFEYFGRFWDLRDTS
jgi:hypothetical protein